MPPRVRKIRHDDETRAKIQASMIINRLQDCVAGKVDLSPAQVSSAKTLLDKVLPNLAAMAMTAQIDTRPAREMSDDELAAIAIRGSAGIDASEEGEE